MPAWFIVTARVHDREAFIRNYAGAAAELTAQYGGTYVLRGPGATQLEGEGNEGASVVVTQWPDRETALRFWNSPEYTALKKAREGLADISITLIGD